MIVVSEFMDSDGVRELRQAGYEVCYCPELWKDRRALLERMTRANALVVRNQTQVDRDLFEAACQLRVVGRLGVGLDNIDLEEARLRGIQIVRPGAANAVAVAEYVLASLLLFARNLTSADQHVRDGGWERTRFGGFELWGKTLGLIGLGNIGTQVAVRTRALGMEVLATDPVRSAGDPFLVREKISLVDLHTLLDESDFVSLHLPSTPETRGLMNWERFQRMRPGSYLVNTARGDLVESEALSRALRSGHLAGAVLDVVDPEPLPSCHPLRGAPNLWITPHVAGLTREAQYRIVARVTRGLVEILEGRE